jgi:molybdopterin-dependent oxidoreductase alpha subunit
MKPLTSGGGFRAIKYTLSTARRVGFRRLWRAMRSKNACKTCALGMGGQLGGMTNEAGHFPEFCKKSLQAMASDMQGRIEDRFFAEYSLDQLRNFSPREMEMMGRLTKPLYAGPDDTHYRPIQWDEALGKIAAKLRATSPEQAFFYSSGRSSNEAGFLLQLFARCYGTNHVNNCSYYCHQASGVALSESLGTATATVALEDLDHADLFFLIGGNPASNHPRLMSTLMRLRRRGGQVIIINPAKELGLVNFRVPSDVRSLLFGSSIASLYVQPQIGGDIALLSGVAKALLTPSPGTPGEGWGEGLLDRAFISSSTENYALFLSHIQSLSWPDIEQSAGVDRSTIQQIADLYVKSKNTIFGWTMGITHHQHGVENVQAIVNLALLRGMVGKPHAGLLPIRGHSNVQGLGSMGVTPGIKKAVLERLETLGVKAPAFPGYDTMACIEAMSRGEMKFGLCLGGNLYGANPDASFSATALSKLDMLVYMSTTLNTGHAAGRGRETLILPVLPRDEEIQSTTQESMFNYVRLSDGGAPRHPGPLSEVSILADIACQTLPPGGPIDWKQTHGHDDIRKLIAKLIPGYEPIEDIGSSRQEFHIPGRVIHAPRFNTPSGKAAFKALPLPALAPLGERQLRLMTVRSEGQFNTVVYEEEDIYRGQERRDVILMNAADIAKMRFTINQPITVRAEAGAMQNILVRSFDVKEGCAMMYCPEANVLVSRAVDPRSKTPAFKSVVVTLEPAASAAPAHFTPVTIKTPRAPMKAC